MGTGKTRLVILRGPSGSGKSAIARGLREHLGRSVALVEQDYLRRVVLKERDVPNGNAIALIDQVVRFALEHSQHVVCEGIMHSQRYAAMLGRLARDHQGLTLFYYFDIAFDECLRRHETRPQATEFGPDHMRQWYQPDDWLGFAQEHIINQDSSPEATTRRILREAFANGESVSPQSGVNLPNR